jgi:hypothetical protein
LNASSFTVVGSGAGDYAVIEVDTIGNVNGKDLSMVSGESIKLTVTSWPTAIDSTTAASDVVLTEVASLTRSSGAKGSNATSAVGSATDGSIEFDNENVDGTVLDGGTAVAAVASGYTGSAVAKGRYFVAVSKATGKAVDKGEYTIRMDLLKSGNVISRQTVKVRFVTNKVDAAAKLAVTAAGVQTGGAAVVQSVDNALTVALTDANGGLVREGNNAQPSVTAAIADPTTTTTTAALTLLDTGASTDNEAVAGDGVYSTTSMLTSITKGTATVTARYGDASATGSVTVIAAATATLAASTFSVSAPGAIATDVATPYAVPITTTEASVTLTASTSSAVVPNHALVATVTWSGNYAAGDVTPKSATPTVVYTDANGKVKVTATNKNPINGAKATISISGCTLVSASTACMADQVIDWETSKPSSISVSPSSLKAAYLSSNTFTATVTDQFGSPSVGAVIQPSITGANKNTTALAVLTTDAAGKVSYTLTDAAATATTTSDTVTFTSAANSAATKGSTVTYVTTVPVIATLVGYFDLAENSSTWATPIPATAILNGTSKLVITQTRNNSKIIATTGTDVANDLVAFRFKAETSAAAAAAGVPVVITTDNGYIVGSSGLAATSRTIITDSTGYVSFVAGSNKTGTVKVTATAGTVAASATMSVGNTSNTDARFVTLTGSKTAVANGEPISLEAKVTDRHGNAVSGVDLAITATGVASFNSGSTTQSFKTDSTGTFTFQGSSLIANGGTGTYKVAITSSGTDSSSVAGFVGTTSVDSTLAAANSSASLDVTFAAGNSATQDAAQAASDAAAEATDAANAATDAANAAAEAADAATAAAQDAADAVAALSTQVSEMVNALKKQITALTNLVIKIQKKVKA